MDAGNRDFRSAQELEPEHPEVKNFMSYMIKKSSNFYQQAMEQMQQQQKAANGNGIDLAEVIRLLTQALSLTPDDMRLLILRAKAYRSAGNLEASLTDIDDATFHYLQSMLGDEVPKHVVNRRMWLEDQSLKSYYREPVVLTQQVSEREKLLQTATYTHYTTLHYTTLHYTTLHYTTLHYTTLHYTTLHYTTLHYTTLHY